MFAFYSRAGSGDLRFIGVGSVSLVRFLQ